MRPNNLKSGFGKQSCSRFSVKRFNWTFNSPVILFKLMSPPAIRAINDYSRSVCSFQYFQAIQENLLLLRSVKCFTHGMTEWIFQMVCTRRFNRLCNLTGNRNAYGRNSLSLDFTLNQTDRLVADTSGWHQQSYINFLLLDFFCCLNSAFLD